MTKDCYILGIHDGHNCGATLSCEGRIVASVQEERLTRRKNEIGYPKLAIEEVMRIGGIDAAHLTEVAYASLFMHSAEHLRNLKPWYRVGIQDQLKDQNRSKEYESKIFVARHRERVGQAASHLNLAENKIKFVEHHTAHLAAAYYTAPNVNLGKPVLGLTCDGAGDGISGSISICRGNDMQRLSVINRHASLGKIYSRVTMLMGMTPWEHEYKLMGLAPYADAEATDVAAKPLRDLLRVDPEQATIVQASEISTNYCYEYLRDAFENTRFDIIAGATQLYTEEMLLDWVRAAIAKTGLTDIVCGGGVFMNVKANMLIAELSEVTSIYVMPSAADESLSIGACLDRYYRISGKTSHKESVLADLYLGGEFTLEDERRSLETTLTGTDIQVDEPHDVSGRIAALLAEGEIVAVSRDRMEWGSRALGNRSILASADDYQVVSRINRMIKMRDFWMPFAPSIKAESASRYIDDKKDQKPYFMTFAYRAKDDTYSDLVAGSHPHDRTVRPQVVTQNANPAYHKVVSEFERRTGRGVILNTSFNIHGEPIAYSPIDAIDVFFRSGLEHLALNHFLLSKTPAA